MRTQSATSWLSCPRPNPEAALRLFCFPYSGRGAAGGHITVIITTLVQVTTPSEIRGRVVGLLAVLSSSLTLIAMGLAGLGADLVGQNVPLIYVTSGTIMAVGALAISSNRAFRGTLATDFAAQAVRVAAMPALASAAPQVTLSASLVPAPGSNPGHGRSPAPAAPGFRRPTADAADPDLRTRDVYEQLPHYPKPLLVPVPRLEDLDSWLAELGQPPGSLARRITDVTLGLTRFRPWLEQLPENIEALQRRHNLRLPGLQTPVISATLALADDPRPLSPLLRAATLILGVRSFYNDLFSGTLTPDTYRGEPLEMGQYPNFFATSQVIEGRGVWLYKSKHVSKINVMVGGHFYLLDIGEPGTEPSATELEAALAEIVRRAREESREPGECSPGVLTCATDRTQRRGFATLQQNPVNRKSLHHLRHTFFTLCLDLDDHPATLEDAALIAHSRNQDNRWFHASFQLVMFGNSRACGICNFTAYLDGNVMMRGAAEIQRRAVSAEADTTKGEASLGSDDFRHPATAKAITTKVERLRWQIPEPLLAQARRNLRVMLDQTGQPATFEIAGYGRRFFAQYGVEAVPTFNLALQMTADRLVSRPSRITQFLSMSRYRCTDLATALVSGPQGLRFAEVMLNPTTENDLNASNHGSTEFSRYALLKAAIQEQAEIARRARRFLPLPVMFNLFLRSKKRTDRLLASLLFIIRVWLLQKLGAFAGIAREVLVSHPEIYPEVPIVGRPGVRLPYVKHFGLHYQIMADKIVITMMPGMRWQVPNAQLIEDLTYSLHRIQQVLEEERLA